MRQPLPHWHIAEHRRWLRETLSPYAILQHLSEAIRPFWVPGGSLLSSRFHTIEAGPACSPFISSSPYAKLRLAYHDQHPEFPMLPDIMQEIMRQQGILLEGVALNYDDWASGKANVDLWLGTVNFPIPEEWNVGTWLLGSLYCATPSAVGMMRCWPNGKPSGMPKQSARNNWSGNHPFRLATTAFSPLDATQRPRPGRGST